MHAFRVIIFRTPQFAGLLSALVSVACSQSARVGNPVGGNVSADAAFTADTTARTDAGEPRTLFTFLDAFSDAYCGRLEDCCDTPASRIGICSRRSSPDRYAGAFDSALTPELIRAGQACVLATQAMACGATNNDRRPREDFFFTAEAQAACDAAPFPRSAGVVCAGAVCDGACINDVCYPKVASGSSCCIPRGACSIDLCQTGDFCNLVNGGDLLCRPRGSVGATCVANEECKSLRCDLNRRTCVAASLQSYCPL